jgi:hypothetical protein
METTLVPQTLYNIRLDHLELLRQIEENEGELTPELYAQLQLTEEQLQDKAVSYAFIYKSFTNTGAIIEAEIKRLQALLQRADKQAETFKARLSEALIQFGVEKIKTPLISISFRKSEAVNITDETLIPADYIETIEVKNISKAKIKDALKEGQQIPGAEIIRRQNLQIK